MPHCLLPRICLLSLGAALLFLLGCAGADPGQPPAAAGLGAPLAVHSLSEEGWEGDLAFGPYRATRPQSQKPNQADWRFVGRRGLVMQQAMSFELYGGDRDWRCLCARGQVSSGMPLNIGTLWGYGFTLDPTQGGVLACILRPASGGKVWRMSLYAPPTKWKDAGRDPIVEGALSDGAATTIRIKAHGVVTVEETGGKMPAFYHFLGDNGPLAQVRVQRPRQVWLPTGPQREPLAAAAGAILLSHGRGAKK